MAKSELSPVPTKSGQPSLSKSPEQAHTIESLMPSDAAGVNAVLLMRPSAELVVS